MTAQDKALMQTGDLDRVNAAIALGCPVFPPVGSWVRWVPTVEDTYWTAVCGVVVESHGRPSQFGTKVLVVRPSYFCKGPGEFYPLGTRNPVHLVPGETLFEIESVPTGTKLKDLLG